AVPTATAASPNRDPTLRKKPQRARLLEKPERLGNRCGRSSLAASAPTVQPTSGTPVLVASRGRKPSASRRNLPTRHRRRDRKVQQNRRQRSTRPWQNRGAHAGRFC